jgi:AmmeMemoRadiSam system protein B
MQQIRDNYARALGRAISAQQLDKIVQHLDRNYFLHNENFRDRKTQLEADFMALPVRPAVHAGQSYESDPSRLAAQIDSFFLHQGGAGKPGTPNSQILRGLVAPHIDIQAGGPCYSHAYRRLVESDDIDCFIIMGTGHYGVERCYATLEKDFETPFGTVTCDRTFQRLLSRNYGAQDYFDVMPHRAEHSIEFQLIFLQHLLQGRSDFTFVPLLCSFSYQLFEYEEFAEDKYIVENFTDALRRTIEQYDKRVCIIASVDFSHVGPRYGDEESPDTAFLERIAALDRELIISVEKIDYQAFHKIIRDNEDISRVCGYSSILTMLKSIQAEKGELLNYSNTTVDEQNSTVTFASMALY